MRKFLNDAWPTVAFVICLIAIDDALDHPVWLAKLIGDFGLLVLIAFWAVVAHFRKD